MFTPTPFAYIVLIGWIPVVVVLFANLRPPIAAAVSFLVGILVLPVHLSFDLPGLPGFERESITTMSVLAALLIFRRNSFRHWLRPKWPVALVVGLAVTPFVTAFTNGDAVTFGSWSAPGLAPWDGAGISLSLLLRFGIPFLIGCQVVRDPKALRSVLTLIVIAASAYSILIFWELKMAPTLHRDLYGYFALGFGTLVRYGGYRPTVFAQTPLYLVMFLVAAVLSAGALHRARYKVVGIPAFGAAAYLSVVLLMSKCLAASVYGLITLPVVIFTRQRIQAVIALVLVAIILSWPSLRGGDLVPTKGLIETAEGINAERAQSLEFRFQNEDQLLALARERIWFGWGTWGRNRVHDPITGEDLSTTDGYWIISLGRLGAFGFAFTFALFVAPIVVATRRYRNIPSQRDQVLLLATALIVAISTTDLLINTTISSFSAFLSGTLLGATGHSRRKPRRRRIARKTAGAEPENEAAMVSSLAGLGESLINRRTTSRSSMVRR